MNAVASVAGSADPLTAAIRSDGSAGRSGTSSTRCSITGTATSAVASVAAIVRSVSAGSNRGRRTIVARSEIATCSIA